MGLPAARRATYQDVLAAPPHMVAEVMDGMLELHPRPAGPHASVASTLGEELGPPFKRGRGGPGGWIILDEPELHLGDDILVPDLGGWRRTRMPHVANVPYFELAPDWACEVLSRSTARLDRGGKLPVYAREKVGHVWLVDPLLRMVEVLRLEGEHYSVIGVHRDDAKVRLEPFDAIELDLAVLWADVVLGEEPR
ncbi:MAG: Uma2 family endonuclease [Deltaproteobacteria bacterium]|nr:Uma2 family endonuclease [Deltaproteobacteria bacterium]